MGPEAGKRTLGALALLMAASAPLAFAEDWPQWRGPKRDGLADSSPPLKSFPKSGPKRLWIQSGIPGQAQGGWGSVAVAEGRIFVYAHLFEIDPESPYVARDATIMRLGWTRKPLAADLTAAIDKALSSPELKKLDAEGRKAWARKWAKDKAPRWQRSVELRLEKGLTTAQARALDPILNRRFPDKASARSWLEERKISEPIIAGILAGLRAIDTRAVDRLICYKAEDGGVLWEKRGPSEPTRFKGSTTPTIAGDRCLIIAANGEVRCHAVADGKLLWASPCKKPAKGKTLASSVLVEDGVVYAHAPYLRALKLDTGQVLWTKEELKNQHSSPTPWRRGGKLMLLCNTGKLSCIDAADGRLLWQVPGGGFSSPVLSGDVAALMSNRRRPGLMVYDLSLDGAELRWSKPYNDRGASPIIVGERIYTLAKRRAVALSLKDGALINEVPISSSEFSSPVSADGKLLAVVQRQLWLFDVSEGPLKKLAAAKLKIAPCTSPALVGGRVYLRLVDGVACYDLTR